VTTNKGRKIKRTNPAATGAEVKQNFVKKLQSNRVFEGVFNVLSLVVNKLLYLEDNYAQKYLTNKHNCCCWLVWRERTRSLLPTHCYEPVAHSAQLGINEGEKLQVTVFPKLMLPFRAKFPVSPHPLYRPDLCTFSRGFSEMALTAPKQT
jgi:hypothetical protein